jgi:hypothetical protein
VDTLIEVLTPLLVIQEYVVCSVVCLLRDISTLRNSFSNIEKFKDRENHDDQLLALHDFLKVIFSFLSQCSVTVSLPN